MLSRFFISLRGIFSARPDSRTSRRITGDAGEEAAVDFFHKSGYEILVRNWRAGRDELDLVALAPESRSLVFIEVKTRDELDPKGGYFAVDTRKKTALRRAVRSYLRAVGRPQAAFRFDIAEVRVESPAPGFPGRLRVIHHCAVPLFPK
jgi:putative endonuclease